MAALAEVRKLAQGRQIDFLEGDLLGTIGAFMHRQNGRSGGDQDGYRSTAEYTDWHTVALDWLLNRCEFWIDGKSIGKSTSRIPNTPMRYVLQTETELNSTYPAKSAVANVQLDYIKSLGVRALSDTPPQPEEIDEDHLHAQPDRGDQEAEYVEAHDMAAKESRSE